MYVAKMFIGSSITPGEVIPSDIPAERLEWLKRAGAVREIAPVSDMSVSVEPKESETQKIGTATETNDAENEASEEIQFEEEEAPEIDVMDGVVAHKGEEPEKPTRIRTRKPATKTKKGGKPE